MKRTHEFNTAFVKFFTAVTEMTEENNERLFGDNPTEWWKGEGVGAIEGRKYVKITRTRDGEHSSVFCFIDKTNGNVLKAASWKSPAKHARGNIYSDRNGMEGVSAYGAHYL